MSESCPNTPDASSMHAAASTTDPVPGTVILEEPLNRGDQVISQVILRKPKAGALRGLKLADLVQLDVDAVATLIPRISTPTLTSADVSNLDPVDLVALSVEIGGFFTSKKAFA